LKIVLKKIALHVFFTALNGSYGFLSGEDLKKERKILDGVQKKKANIPLSNLHRRNRSNNTKAFFSLLQSAMLDNFDDYNYSQYL
jgi:hypothetical protein